MITFGGSGVAALKCLNLTVCSKPPTSQFGPKPLPSSVAGQDTFVVGRKWSLKVCVDEVSSAPTPLPGPTACIDAIHVVANVFFELPVKQFSRVEIPCSQTKLSSWVLKRLALRPPVTIVSI